ncbi:MAG: hypothetical protein KC476_04530 [Cyanobacteria bacterium HKST-UBA06]|nr:hypothetical protein [Cyanobacteria bacterium HKST-UBA06]
MTAMNNAQKPFLKLFSAHGWLKAACSHTVCLSTAIALALAPAALATAGTEQWVTFDDGYAFAATLPEEAPKVHVVGEDPGSEKVKSLLAAFDDLLRASNNHSLDDVIRHYSPQFISGDHFNLAELKQLIIETWEAYPDIRYTSAPIEIRFNKNWATMETLDGSTATAPPDKEIMENTPGKMKSQSRSLLFFKQVGDGWELTSDYTLWEEAVIRYGVGEEVPITLSAPDQVKAGQSYSAVVSSDVAENTFIVGNIDNQAIKVPRPEPDQKFRAMEGGPTELQRVLVANAENRNEIVTATLGLTNILQKYEQERPSLSLNGIVTIVKRVNVIPVSYQDMVKSMDKQQLVDYSADGRVDLSKLVADEEKPVKQRFVNDPRRYAVPEEEQPDVSPESEPEPTETNHRHSPFRK